MKYEKATEASAIAEDLIEQWHPHLESLRVECVFIDKTPTKNGKAIWAKATKKSGLDAFFAANPYAQESGDVEDFFVIVISKPVWTALTADQRKALIDHELEHCRTEEDEETGDVKLVLVGHDVEEFSAIIDRHGINWRPDLSAFFRKAHDSGQLALGLAETSRSNRIGNLRIEAREPTPDEDMAEVSR